MNGTEQNRTEHKKIKWNGMARHEFATQKLKKTKDWAHKRQRKVLIEKNANRIK